MPFLNPNSPIAERLIEKTVDTLAKAANKTGTPLAQVAEYLPPTAGAYMAHVGKAQQWVSPVSIVGTNVQVFKKCMQLSNDSITLFCISKGAICALQLVPGPHQGPAIVLCQTLILFTKNI